MADSSSATPPAAAAAKPGPLAFAFVGAVVAATFVLVWTGKVTGDHWVSTTTWVTNVLILGQAAGLAVNSVAGVVKAKVDLAVAQVKGQSS